TAVKGPASVAFAVSKTILWNTPIGIANTASALSPMSVSKSDVFEREWEHASRTLTAPSSARNPVRRHHGIVFDFHRMLIRLPGIRARLKPVFSPFQALSRASTASANSTRSGIMKPRSVALALGFCVSLLSNSYAQQIPKARQQRLIALAKQLHVTGKQAKKLYPIMQGTEPQHKAIRNASSPSRVEKWHRFHAVQDPSDPKVKAILTPAQFHQLQATRQQRRAQLLAQAKGEPHQGGAARSAH